MEIGKALELSKLHHVDVVHGLVMLAGFSIDKVQLERLLFNSPPAGKLDDSEWLAINVSSAMDSVLNVLGEKTTSTFLRVVHGEVCDGISESAGVLRTKMLDDDVMSWHPDYVTAEEIDDSLERLSHISNAESKAVAVFAYIMKECPFNSHNEIIAAIACDKILLENGYGTLVFKQEIRRELYRAEKGWYESGKPAELFSLLKEKCILRA